MDLFGLKASSINPRSSWIDYDKGISIILVGYGHSFAVLSGHGLDFKGFAFIEYIGAFFYGFRMPLFFIISGLLLSGTLKRKGLKGYIQDRMGTILYPLIIWGGIETTIRLLGAPGSTDWSIAYQDYGDLLLEPRNNGVFWYLNALFFIGTLYALSKSFLKLKVMGQFALGLVMFSLAAFFRIRDIQLGFLMDILGYYVFFALGDLSSKLLLSAHGKQLLTAPRFFLPLVLIFIALQYYCMVMIFSEGSAGIAHVEKKMPFVFLIQAVIGCCASISLSFMLEKVQLFPWLKVIGYHSLFIYCMQILTMNALRILLVKMLGAHQPAVIFLLTWILGIALPIIAYNLAIKCGLWWLFSLKKPIVHLNADLQQAKADQGKLEAEFAGGR